EPDGVQEPVVPVQGDQPGDAEERRGGHVVAADREAVLHAGEGPAAGVEVGGAPGVAARPHGDRQGGGDEGEEQQDREGLVAHRASSALPAAWAPSASISPRILSATGSRRRSAWREYR